MLLARSINKKRTDVVVCHRAQSGSMRNKCLLGFTLAAFFLPTPLLAETRSAQTYLNWCQNNVRDGSANTIKHCSWYKREAANEGLGVWVQTDIEAAVQDKRRLVADEAPPSTDNTSSGSDEPVPSDNTSSGSDEPVPSDNTSSGSDEPIPSDNASSGSDSEPPVSTPLGVPKDWDEAWHDPFDLDGKDSNGESTPYVKDLIAKMGSDLLGSGFTPGQAYLSRNYMGYDNTVHILDRGNVYVRHTGTDFMKPIGSTVRALTSGEVVATYNDPQTSNQALAVVKEDGADRWWVYLHTSYRVMKGQHLVKGAVIGTIVDPMGEWPRSHVHVNVMTTWPISPAVAQYLSLGRSYHPDKGEAIRFAKTYTMHPLEAYALANGLVP